jgi:hypothetical protein
MNGRAHLLLADILLSLGRKAQARLELRIAVQDDGGLADGAAPLAVAASANDQELLDAVPSTPAAVRMLEVASGKVDPGRRLALLEEATRRSPDAIDPRIHLAENYLGALDPTVPGGPCAGDKRGQCEERLSAQLDTIERLRPAWSRGFVLRAWMLAYDGRANEGAALLARRCPQVDDRFECLSMEAHFLLVAKQSRDADVLLRELAALPCGSAAECAGQATRIGDLYARKADWGNALTQYTRAADAEPSAVAWLRVADAAAALGSHGDAVRALEAALRVQGDAKDPALRARLEQERHQAIFGH